MLHAIVNHDGDSFIHKARDLGMPNLLSMSVVGGSTFVAQTMIRSTLRLEGYSVDTFNVYPVRLGFRKAVANLTGGTLEYVTIKDIQAISWTRRRRRLQSGGEVEDPSRRRLGRRAAAIRGERARKQRSTTPPRWGWHRSAWRTRVSR